MSDKKTLTTGPFHIPAFNVFGNQNRLVIEIKNPTDNPLEVKEVILGVCPPPPTFTPPLQLHLDQIETEFTLFTNFVVDGQSCRRIERVIPFTDLRGTYRVTTTGEYEVEDNRPRCGKLEIYVTFGVKFLNISSSGLDKAEESISFPYSAFLVCDDNDDDDDSDS